MIDNLIQFIARLLSGIYSLPVVGGSYGLSIMLLTLGIMVVVMPLTLRATKSTIKMSMVAPELKRIQKEFKEDKERQNEEMMALYREHGINPIGGCLPVLAQAPIFLVLFQVIRGLTRRFEDAPFAGVVNKVYEVQERASAAPQPDEFFPRYLDRSSDMFNSLIGRTEMTFLRVFDLGAQPNEVLSTSLVKAIPYLLLIVFLVGSSFYQQKQITARRSPTGDGDENPVLQQQQAILKFLPFLTGIWSFFFPTGLSIYWATSNTFRIGQQAYITRTIYAKKDDMEASFQERLEARKKETKPPETKESEAKAEVSTDEAQTGAAGTNGDSKVEQRRQKELARQKAIKAKARAKAKAKSDNTDGRTANSTRVTPKGTKPQQRKKKR
ncbi:MAG: membrane protein insertase YidC [Acidimicrobiia bacterium]|nr:membrane protein insertase YidC [Acidimicrobiia bacterium]